MFAPISWRLVGATKEKLTELLSSDLSGHDAAVLMIDGIVFHECCCVVALLITADGSKIPVGVWEGDTENTTVVKHLLADLVARGLSLRARPARRHRRRQGACCRHQARLRHARLRATLRVARALARGRLPRSRVRPTDRPPDRRCLCRSRRAGGLKVARGLAAQLDREHPSAAASLHEGIEDMFTVRLVSSGVKRWRDPAMVRRWVATGMIEAQRSFRRIKGCKDMTPFVAAIRAEVAQRLAEDQQEMRVTAFKYDHPAA